MQSTTFLHSGSIGDVWASLPALREHYRKTGKKAILYLLNGYPGNYYEGATHPTTNEKGEMVLLNEAMINMMLPLLNAQEYIECAKIWNYEYIEVDLNKIRETYVGMPYFSINRWYFYVYPDLSCDLSVPWMHIPERKIEKLNGKILVNRTQRYQNQNINYSFLKKYQDRVLFVGTETEFKLFKSENNLDIERHEIVDFLDLAQAIQNSAFCIGNQSQFFQICEGVKKPRILELCSFAPNVIPIGEDGYDFFAQVALEYYTETLFTKYCK